MLLHQNTLFLLARPGPRLSLVCQSSNWIMMEIPVLSAKVTRLAHAILVLEYTYHITSCPEPAKNFS